MKTKFVAAIIILFSLPGIKSSYAQGIDFIHDKKFQELLDMAKKQNKLVFMDCYTSWCGPCKRLAATVFPDPKVGDFFNATFINAKFDMEKDEGVSIANRYGIRAYPTLLWLDGDGNVKFKEVGGLEAEGLIEQGRKAIDTTPEVLERMRNEYAAGKRLPEFLGSYASLLFNAGDKYEDIFKEFLDKLAPNDFSDTKTAQLIIKLTNDIKSPGLAYLVKNKDYYRNLIGDEAFEKKINDIATKAASEAPHANDKGMFDGAVELLKSVKARDHEQREMKLSMDYYSSMGDWNNFDKFASQYIKKYGDKNAALLNDVAWDYFLNVNDANLLRKATKWAYEAINIDNKYTYNLTYAYLLYKQYDFHEAEKACDYAVIRANAENVSPSSANALKDAIEKSLAKKD